MNQIVRQQSDLASVSDSDYTDIVAECLGLLIESGLKTYGLTPGLDAWCMAFRHKGIGIHEVKSATAAYVSGECGREMPSAGEFCQWILTRRVDLERQQELRDMAEMFSLGDEQALRARLLEKFGHENPSREEWAARLSKLGVNPMAPKAKAVTEVFKPGRNDLEDPAQAARLKEQTDAARRILG